MGARLARLTLPGTLAQIRYVRPVHPARAQGLVAAVYGQVQRDFGMLAPPIVLHSPAPGPLAASWLILRESLVARGRADRAAKEAVAAGVSLANACPYCVAIHTIALRGLGFSGTGKAIAAGRLDTVADARLRAIAQWAAGQGDPPVEDFAELASVAVTFEYLNRMVNVFLTESPVPPSAPALVRKGVPAVAGWLMAPFVRKARQPGTSLELLAEAPPPPQWSWAAGNPRLESAFGRAYAAIEAAGTRAVPAAVRELVRVRLRDWDGRPYGPSRAWVSDAVAPLAVPERAVARLALLTAFASYQVGPAVIDGYRRAGGDDAGLIDVASWAALTAAAHAGTRLTPHRGETCTGAAPP